MFKFAHTKAVDRAVWDDDDAEQIQVQYNDGGLQQQLAAHLQNNKTSIPRAAATGPPSSALTQRAWRRPASPPSQSPPAAEVHALIGDLQHLTQAAFQDEVYSPRQQQLAADQSQAIKEHHVQQRASQLQAQAQSNTAAVLNSNRQLLEGLLQAREQQPEHEQQQQPRELHAAQGATTMLSNPWSQHPQQQPLSQLPQHQPQLQQTQQQHQQQAPASLGHLLAPQSQKPAPAKPVPHKGQQQRRKSVLYTTPQQQAPKKKPRFSIRDTPAATGGVHRTPGTANRPRTAAAAAAAAGAIVALSTQGMPSSQAGGFTGPSALAALLGGNSTTPARHRHLAAGAGVGRTGESVGAVGAAGAASADFSKTPGSTSRKGGLGVSGLFPTPRFSTNKGSRLGHAVQQSPAPGFGTGSIATDSSSKPAGASIHAAAAADVIEEAAELTPVPAALFQEEEAPAAAAAVTPQISRDKTSHGRRSSITSNPLQIMEEQRQRQAQFLSALPAAAATRSSAFSSNSGMLNCLTQSGGRGVQVPVGSSLAKVMQRIVAAQKEQQELLEQQIAEGGSRQHPAGLLELEVVSKHWEAHMVKCLCTITACQQQQQQQQGPELSTQQPQQKQQKLGEQVFLFVASKTALNVELSPGHRVRMHFPWYEVAQQAPDQIATVLAYLISSVV